MPEFINSPSQVIYNRIKITICDPLNGYIEGIDMYGQSIRLAYSFYYSPYIQIPRIDEYWVVKKIDNNWNLYARFESDDQIRPITDLNPGDIRIESKNILYVDADEEIVMDFNKAAPSLRNLEENTLPGTALFGSGTLDQFSAGTLITTNKFITPVRTSLSTADVADGQEERYQNNNADGIVWNFRYDDDVETVYKWHFIGGPAHISFVTGTVSTTGTSWFNSGTNTAGVQPFVYGGSPTLTIPYTGEYILSGGGETIASANNMGFNFGLSINGSIPTSTLTTYAPVKDTAMSVNTTYYAIFNAGDVLTEIYRKDPAHNPSGTAKFLNRWISITPIRVTT